MSKHHTRRFWRKAEFCLHQAASPSTHSQREARARGVSVFAHGPIRIGKTSAAHLCGSCEAGDPSVQDMSEKTLIPKTREKLRNLAAYRQDHRAAVRHGRGANSDASTLEGEIS